MGKESEVTKDSLKQELLGILGLDSGEYEKIRSGLLCRGVGAATAVGTIYMAAPIMAGGLAAAGVTGGTSLVAAGTLTALAAIRAADATQTACGAVGSEIHGLVQRLQKDRGEAFNIRKQLRMLIMADVNKRAPAP